MKKHNTIIAAAAMVLTVLISNTLSLFSAGHRLDELRGSVLRLHILANSDSEEDQRLKLCVRDALLEKSGELFGEADSLEEAEAAAAERLAEIESIAEAVLREQGCPYKVSAEITDMHFDERIYGDITMPQGDYRALRIGIGDAGGHNWWCVMYPPLCIPAACSVSDDKETEERFFDSGKLDILYRPKKYRVRFAVWDKLKKLFG